VPAQSNIARVLRERSRHRKEQESQAGKDDGLAGAEARTVPRAITKESSPEGV
jgi:hypothetical protein